MKNIQFSLADSTTRFSVGLSNHWISKILSNSAYICKILFLLEGNKKLYVANFWNLNKFYSNYILSVLICTYMYNLFNFLFNICIFNSQSLWAFHLFYLTKNEKLTI